MGLGGHQTDGLRDRCGRGGCNKPRAVSLSRQRVMNWAFAANKTHVELTLMTPVRRRRAASVSDGAHAADL